jgi:plasmid stabilization system protein ParE
MTGIRFLPPAEAEFLQAMAHYEEQAPGLGADFVAEIERVVALIVAHPQLGTPGPWDTRRILIRRFPFNVVYQPQPDFLLIVAVAHQRRRPGYWRARLVRR